MVALCFAIAAICAVGALITWLADTRFGLFLEQLDRDDDFNGNGRLPGDRARDERSTL